jgi:DNA ligase D-like protein (predicted 3'-phosphoesterase)
MAYVAWLSGRELTKKLAREGKNVANWTAIKNTNRTKRDEIYMPLLHEWIDNMLYSQSDNWEDGFKVHSLNDWLVTPEKEDIPSDGPGTFFFSQIGGEVGKPEEGDYGFKFNFRAAEKRGGLRTSTNKARLLRVIGIWKISESEYNSIRNKMSKIKGISDRMGLREAVPKMFAQEIITSRHNKVSEMDSHNYDTVSLNRDNTDLLPGDFVLVQALVMPGFYKWEPLQSILKLRKDSDDEHIFENFGELAIRNNDDVDFWRGFNNIVSEIKKRVDKDTAREKLNQLIQNLRSQYKEASLSIRAKDPLSKYKGKREFNETPEPEGKVEGKNKYRFVIQKHKAKRAGCLPREVRIITRNGPVKIGDIVKNKLKLDVLSFNRNYGLEWKPIVNWFENGSTSEWIHVKTDYNYSFVSTKNHKVYKKCDNLVKKCLAKDLVPGDYLFVGDEEITQDQLDFMVGSLLGDGSITKTNGLVFSYGQSKNEKEPYIKKLASVFKSKVEVSSVDKNHKNNFYYLRKRHKINHMLYDMFYDSKKIIKDEMLDFINEKVLAVWFMDDGQWSPAKSYFGNNKLGGVSKNLGRDKFSGQIYLYTNGFTKNDNIKLINFLKNKFNLNFTLRSRFDKKQDKFYYWLALNNKNDIEIFFNLIYRYIDKRFQYKCPIEVGNYTWQENEEQYCLFPIKISEIVEKKYYSYNKNKTKQYLTKVKKFDIEVADNHNYFAGGILVSNSHFDLRLENEDGTMSSWSIPKHKLPKGKERILAIKTEDHPISYMKFKGKIPKGYGAGIVDIHDSGTYDEIEWGKSKIVFKLKGKKEKGTYKLFSTNGNKWMIMEDKIDK